MLRKLLYTLLNYNLLPDFILRWIIRRGVRQTALEHDASEPETSAAKKQAFVDDLKQRDVAVHQVDANEQHYEVPPEFFKTVLGPKLKYSSCYWGKNFEMKSLAASEDAMLQLCCDRAGIADGMSVLDLGCGWGSMALYVAEHYDCTVTALSNSQPQGDFIRNQVKAMGVDVNVITADASTVQLTQKFDRIVSVEMFEHMKNYEKLLRKLESWLNPDGKLFVHIFTTRQLPYHFERGWMASTFFTGGMMPSEDLFFYFQQDLRIEKHWALSGKHYEKTLNTWLQKMDQYYSTVRNILHQTYAVTWMRNASRRLQQM